MQVAVSRHRAKGAVLEGRQVPDEVLDRVEQAEREIAGSEAKWQECLAFFDGDQYVEVSAIDGRLDRLETREGTSKPRHRVRLTRNRYTTAIQREASACTSRTPDFECIPINGERNAVTGARLGEKALAGQYDNLAVRTIAGDVVVAAKTTGAGFTWPYWNADVGEILTVADPQTGQPVTVREGEIGVWVLNQLEVLWDHGVDFYDSRWYVVRKAQPVGELTRKKGYIGPEKLQPDAMSAPHEARRGEEAKNLAYVYHYLERPCEEYPQGRWITFCAGQLIFEEQPYPNDRDEPCLQWVPDIRRRHRARPMGTGELMLDIQRTYNRTVSQIVAFKNLVLNPQVFAPVGSLKQQLDDTPGAVFQFKPVAGMQPQWRDMPELPVGLFRVLDQCLADWAEVVGQQPLPQGIESGSGVQALEARDDQRRDTFMAGFADWYARFGMALLDLMRRHYTEERLLAVQGAFGVEMLHGFRGMHLHGIAQVRVRPQSIAPRNRAQQQAILMNLADRGLFAPEKVIMALNAGTADVLIDEYELDRDKALREIQLFKDMATGLAETVPEVDPIVDNHAVHLEVIRGWMKTRDFETQPPLVQEAARLHAQGHDFVDRQLRMQAAMEQSMAAEQLGMSNAGRPQAPNGPGANGRAQVGAPKPEPSKPSMKTSAQAADAAEGR